MFEQIDIFDFDGTLFKVCSPKEGIKIYEKETKTRFVNKDWWGSPESLLPPVPVLLKKGTAFDFFKSLNDPFKFTIVMTGRNVRLLPVIENILKENKLNPQMLILCDEKDVLNFKLKKIKELCEKFPSAKRIKMWEDKPAYKDAYEKFSTQVGIPISVKMVYDNDAISQYVKLIMAKQHK